MEVILLFAFEAYLIGFLVESCSVTSVENGRLLFKDKQEIDEGQYVMIECDAGYVSDHAYTTCSHNSTWDTPPVCSKVSVKFDGTSMIKYTYPVPFDSSNSSISFSFSTNTDKSSGVLIHLTGMKTQDSDSLTVELVEGYFAVTMQLKSRSQNVVAFCHYDMLFNDELVHTVVLTRRHDSLSLTIDEKSISCSYPIDREMVFSSLRNIQVGHLNPTWGPHYGFSGCMSELAIDDLDLFVMSHEAVNSGSENGFSFDNIDFTSSCGDLYKAPTKPATQITTTLRPTSSQSEERGETDDSFPEFLIDGVLIISVTTLSVSLAMLLFCGVMACRAMVRNKRSYVVDESRLTLDSGEREYYL